MSKRVEKIIIDKPYGKVVIKTRDVNVIKEDLEFERFLEKCEITYYGPMDNLEAIKISYKHINENGDDITTKQKMILDDKNLTSEFINELKLNMAYNVFKKVKAHGVDI